jgi:hypothetical protein
VSGSSVKSQTFHGITVAALPADSHRTSNILLLTA